ncbi:hypothetical protein D9M72_586250 [compost metagenome]
MFFRSNWQEIRRASTSDARCSTAFAERCQMRAALSAPSTRFNWCSGTSISCWIMAVLAMLLPLIGFRRSTISTRSLCPMRALAISAPLIPAPTISTSTS